jgi:hypothetical protein
MSTFDTQGLLFLFDGGEMGRGEIEWFPLPFIPSREGRGDNVECLLK